MRNKRTLAFPSPFFLVGSSLTSLGMSSAKRKASPPPAGRGKRKRVVLTISQKLEICDLVTSRRLSYGDIARKYGIGRQTVADKKKGEGLARVSTHFYYPDNLGYTDTRESASAQHCLDNRGRTVYAW